MALVERIKQFFKYSPRVTDRIQEKLPFIMLMGTEKTYGKPQPNDYRSMVDNYKSWAYACAWKNATSAAKGKICLYKPTYDNAKEKQELSKIEQHPFLDLIKSVNPFSNKFELMVLTVLNLELTGNAYWYMPKNPLGIPSMIWNLPSHWVKIVPSVTEFIEGYVVTIPNRPTPIPFDESEIVHFKYPSPSDLFYGQGPLWGGRLAIDLSNQIKEWGVSFFLNNAQPSGILTTDNSLTPDQYQRLRDQWNEKYKGTKNAGKMAFLEGGMKYQQMGSNVRDARFDDVSADIRNEILAIFGVPASKLGLEAHDNRATAEASDYTYQSETILPRLILIEEKINEKIIPLYDDRLIMKFENTVPEDRQFKLQEKQINLQTGLRTIDEVRIEEGLEPFNLPETTVPLIPFSLTPAGTPRPDPAAVPGQEDEKSVFIKEIHQKKRTAKWEVFAHATAPQERLFAEVMKRFFEQQHSEAMRNINAFKSFDGASMKASESPLFNMHQANERLKGISKANLRNAYITGLELGMKDTRTAIDFTLFEPNILRAVEDRVSFFAVKINEATADLIEQQLTEALKAGESIADVARRIDSVFNFSEGFRSKMIAQTEIIGATNAGQLKAYDEAGIKQKEWISARDEKVRESHKIDGQTVDLHQSFTTGDGNKLQYPGDRSSGAPVGDLINCRCTLLPVIKT